MRLPRHIIRVFCAAISPLLLLSAGQGVAADAQRQVATGKQLKDVFKRLGAEDFQARESAQIELQNLAIGDDEATLSQTLDTYLKTTDPEVRYRLRSAMFNAIAANTQRKGFIGISMHPGWVQGVRGNFERLEVVRVMAIIPGSSADDFGLEAGDEIVEIDGKPFTKDQRIEPNLQLQEYVRSLGEGDPLRLSIRRRGKMIDKEIKLGGMPDEYDPDFKENVFEDWLHEELVDRGLAEPRPTIMPSPDNNPPRVRILPGTDPRLVPRVVPRVAPQRQPAVPIPPENLFPEK